MVANDFQFLYTNLVVCLSELVSHSKSNEVMLYLTFGGGRLLLLDTLDGLRSTIATSLLHPCYILLHLSSILVTSLLHPYYILVTPLLHPFASLSHTSLHPCYTILHPCYILVLFAFWLHPFCILVTSFLHP